MEERLSRLMKWARGDSAPPSRLELHLTNRCNLSCLSCWAWSTAKPPEDRLDDARLLTLIDEAHLLGIRDFWLVGGGEPLLRTNTCLAVQDRIMQGGGRGHLVTNGTLFTGTMLEWLVTKGWEMVVVSVDGPDAPVNDHLRNRAGVFDTISKSLLSLAHLKKTHGVEKPIVRINTVISGPNIDRLDGMLNFAAVHGAREVLFHSMNVLSPRGAELQPTAGQMVSLRDRIPALELTARRLGVETNIGRYRESFLLESTAELDRFLLGTEDGLLGTPCFDPWERMIVLPDGRAGSCNAFREQGLVDRRGVHLQDEVCDDAREKNLGEIWYGSVMTQVRRGFMAKLLLPICLRCCVGNILENQRLRAALKESHAVSRSGGERDERRPAGEA
ncbi:radical SAM protein [bacterium]|nr:radical SAM protein [candidate division CSSED10-310 bacterium]